MVRSGSTSVRSASTRRSQASPALRWLKTTTNEAAVCHSEAAGVGQLVPGIVLPARYLLAGGARPQVRHRPVDGLRSAWTRRGGR